VFAKRSREETCTAWQGFHSSQRLFLTTVWIGARSAENNLKQFDIKEPQADEIRTFVDDRKRTTWAITFFETTSRLWPSCLVGKRSYRNIRRLFRDTLSRSESHERLLITPDGFKPYG
jgi:hypothetical protein